MMLTELTWLLWFGNENNSPRLGIDVEIVLHILEFEVNECNIVKTEREEEEQGEEVEEKAGKT